MLDVNRVKLLQYDDAQLQFTTVLGEPVGSWSLFRKGGMWKLGSCPFSDTSSNNFS